MYNAYVFSNNSLLIDIKGQVSLGFEENVCLFVFTTAKISDIEDVLAHITEGICRPLKVGFLYVSLFPY